MLYVHNTAGARDISDDSATKTPCSCEHTYLTVKPAVCNPVLSGYIDGSDDSAHIRTIANYNGIAVNRVKGSPTIAGYTSCSCTGATHKVAVHQAKVPNNTALLGIAEQSHGRIKTFSIQTTNHVALTIKGSGKA